MNDKNLNFLLQAHFELIVWKNQTECEIVNCSWFYLKEMKDKRNLITTQKISKLQITSKYFNLVSY